MFLDNPNNRISISDEIKNFIIEERTKHNLSATKLAKKMGRPQSWIAQIENGRTKTIKQEDLVFIISNILDVDVSKADEFLSESLSGEDIKSLSDEEAEAIDKQSIRRIGRYCEYTDNENEKEFRMLKRFIVSALNDMYKEVPDHAVRVLRLFCANIKFDFSFIMGVASLPFVALSDLDEDVNYEVYTKIADVLIEYANKDKERVKRIERNTDADDDDEIDDLD